MQLQRFLLRQVPDSAGNRFFDLAELLPAPVESTSPQLLFDSAAAAYHQTCNGTAAGTAVPVPNQPDNTVKDGCC